MEEITAKSDAQKKASSVWVATLIVLGMIIASSYYLYSTMSNEAPLMALIDGLPGTEGVNRLPPDFTTKTLGGERLQMSGFRGKVVVLDFWATWCPPCRQEIPHLVRLSEKYRRRGLEIVALTIEDASTDQEKIQSFAERFKINYTIGYATEEIFTTYIGPGEQPIPQTLIFDRAGRLRAHFISFDAKRDPQRLENIITDLL